MKQKTKKKIAVNLPYIFIGLLGSNIGEAWRLSESSGFREKIQDMVIHGGLASESLFKYPAGASSDRFCIRHNYCFVDAACSISQKQECQEISTWKGVRLCEVGKKGGYRTIRG